MPRTPFALYVFDLDGTLVDSRADLAAAVNAARGALGLPALPLETIAGYVGEGVARLIERALGPEGTHLHDQATRLFRAHYREHLLDHTAAYEGVAELLTALREGGARVAVATNKPEAFARAILDGLGLGALVERVVGGDTLARRKPDALPIAHLVARFEVSREATLMVGDSAIDAQAAKAAGVALCAVTWGIGRRADLAAHAPLCFADHPREVLRASPRDAT